MSGKPIGRGPARGRISFRETLTNNQKSLDLYAALAGKPTVENRILASLPAPRTRAPAKPSAVPLEKDVQKAIIDGLRVHPMIGLVERVNSGSAVERNADGSDRHIQFHHVYSVGGERMKAVDLHCTLKRNGKRFVIEVKRPGWNGPKDPREEGQLAYIQYLRSCGAFGMFACSWEEVEIELRRIAVLEGYA